MNSSETWVTTSSGAQQTVAGIVLAVVGFALAIGFKHFATSDSFSGFLLGVLCLVIGVGMLLTGGKEVISVEPRLKRIVITSHGRFRTRAKTIHFKEISQIHVGEHGDTEGGSIRYYVAVKLKTGKEIALFFGFFAGAQSKSAMNARCQRLIENMRTDA